MALGEADALGPEAEESRAQELDVIARGSALESFTESQEVRGLVGGLAAVCGDRAARETAVEKFIGEHGDRGLRAVVAFEGGVLQKKRAKTLILV